MDIPIAILHHGGSLTVPAQAILRAVGYPIPMEVFSPVTMDSGAQIAPMSMAMQATTSLEKAGDMVWTTAMMVIVVGMSTKMVWVPTNQT